MLDTLIKLGPVVTILVAVVVYLYKKLGKREEEVKKLNEYIRESDKENIRILDKISHTLDRVIDREESNTDKVLTELRNLRDALLTRIENGK